MKKTLLIIISLLLLTHVSFAQFVHFTTSGTIQFEKTSNVYAIITKQINKDNEAFLQPAFEEYKKNHTQFRKAQSTLTFAGNITLFAPAQDADNTQNGFFDMPIADQNNIIYTDMATSKSISQKKVFEETFLLNDSTRKIKWKITDETREIAGYTCRRANGILMDSIYVVAFYTDKIHISGGPESFTGLPGMMLGVALPHENVTWFATKVTETPISSSTLLAPKKGKPVNKKEFLATLQSVMKNWGDYAQIYLKAFVL